MLGHTTRILNIHDLTWVWTKRTIQARYQQSILGWLWAVVQPVATVAIFTVVFTYFVPVDTGGIPYVLFSYTAVVPWTFLATSLPDMSSSLVQNMTLVTKIYFPREALPIAAMLARMVDFGISAILLAILLILYRAPLSLTSLFYLPGILAIQLLLVLGLGMGSAAANVFYRDIDPLLRLVLQLWFYASPIIYPVSLVPEKWWPVYFLNPMAGVIVGYRDILLFGKPPDPYVLVSAAISVAVFLIGIWFFRKVEWQFADIV